VELRKTVDQVDPQVLRSLANLGDQVAVHNPLGISQAKPRPLASAMALIAEIGESMRRSSSPAISSASAPKASMVRADSVNSRIRSARSAASFTLET
jgi:hypothetical protein